MVRAIAKIRSHGIRGEPVSQLPETRDANDALARTPEGLRPITQGGLIANAAQVITVVGTIAGTLIGALIGFFSTQIAEWLKRRRHHKAYWGAIRAEMEICEEHGKAYLQDSVEAPSYRLPKIAFEKGFPVLLEDGGVSPEAAKAVLRYYAQVDQMNRVLEQAHKAYEADNDDMRQREKKRLLLKAKHVSSSGDYHGKAIAAVDAAITQIGPWWRFWS